MRRPWLVPWGIGSVAFGGSSLLVPLYLVARGGSVAELGLLAAAAALVAASGSLLFGRLATTVAHRRWLVLGTLATVALSLAVLPFLQRAPAIIAVNTVCWLAAGSVPLVVTMLVVDGVPEPQWNEQIGRLNTYQGYGWAGGLVLGTVWPLVGGRLVGDPTAVLFWLLAVAAAVSAVGVARTLPRTSGTGAPDERRAHRVARLLASSSRNVAGATFPFTPNRLYWATRRFHPAQLRARLTPTLAAYLAAAFLFFTGSAVFWAPLPLFLTERAFGSSQVFFLYLLSSAASALLYGWVGRARVDLRRLQASGLLVRGLLFPAVALLAGVASQSVAFAAAAVGFTVIGATWAVIAVAGTALVTRHAPPAIRSETLGIYTALGAVGGGVGSALGGWVATAGYGVAFALAGGLLLASGLFVATLRGLSRRYPSA
ncbi:MFS transporter [Halosegnis longus]|uniref:MFS transporter n=1 Tax=Halosegnis longus TaxID=2216012 RepID=UPI00129E861B|nr:MFS transporter [Halosegnis longus]